VVRPPRAPQGAKSGAAKAAESNPTNVSSEEALAQTVGSGDHGKPPMAIADTLASGDHRDSRPTLGTGPGLAKDTALPKDAPAKPRSRALLVAIAAVVVAGGVVLAIALTRKDDSTQVATTTPVDAASPTADATVIAMVPVDAAPPPADAAVVEAAADAAPTRARVDARVKDRPDGAGGATTNPEADETYEKGLAALAKDPERTKDMGYRLRDRYDDVRGWVLIGAASCPLKKKPLWVEANAKLKAHGPLLKKLWSLCRNNKPE
jgi:hypothetical protein